MKKNSIFSKLLSCTIAITTLFISAPKINANAAVTWNNTSDVSWIDSSKKIIAFAFDDGPVSYSDSATSILDTLEENNMHATFFYIGNQITSTNQSEIERANNLGCEVASHTYSHPYLTNLSTSEIEDEVNKNIDILSEITGKSDFLIRPPYLATNDTVLNTINVPLITCSIDTLDWNNASTEDIIKTVLYGAKDGDILLMHETLSTTAEAVKYLVPELVKRGFVITSVSELFKMKGQEMTSGNVYYSCSGPNVIDNSVDSTPLTDPTADLTPSTDLKLDYSVNNWGSAYQVNFKISNISDSDINSWLLKIKKDDIDITTSWGINIEESGDYYLIRPEIWDTTITSGGCVDFGIQGPGSIGDTISYTLY